MKSSARGKRKAKSEMSHETRAISYFHLCNNNVEALMVFVSVFLHFSCVCCAAGGEALNRLPLLSSRVIGRAMEKNSAVEADRLAHD